MGELSREEFLAHVGYIREDVQAVHDRLDTLNGRTRVNENAIAVLTDRSEAAKKDGRKYGAGFGAAGATVVGALYALWEMVTK